MCAGCFVNTILAVLARRQNNALFLLESVASSPYTHIPPFFGSAWHLEIPTYWEWLLIDTCTTPYSYLHRAAMIAQCLIRLEARFLACLFLFSLKLECEKLVQEKTEMQRHYVMVSLHIWTNRCKPLQQFSFMPICPDEKFAARLCINKTAEKNCGTDFLTHESISVLRDVLRPECWDAQAGDASS